MKRIKLLLAVVAAMMLMAMSAVPASASPWWNDRHDNVPFWGWGYYPVIEEVDYVNVRERNPRDGECYVQDVDFDGWIAEWEIVCYR